MLKPESQKVMIRRLNIDLIFFVCTSRELSAL